MKTNISYVPFLEKDLNYVDIKQIVLITLSLKDSYNKQSILEVTREAWFLFKGKLSFGNQVIFKEMLVNLRKFVYSYLEKLGYNFAYTFKIYNEYLNTVSNRYDNPNTRKRLVRETAQRLLDTVL